MADDTTSVSDLITTALRRIKVIQAGETPTPDDLADGLIVLNDFLAAKQINNLLIYAVTRSTWSITPTKGTLSSPYTVGTTGDITIARPNFIHAIKYQRTTDSPVTEYPLQLMTEDAWRSLPQKNLTGTLPVGAYFEPTYPLGSLYFNIIPSSANLQGVIYAATATPTFAATSDLIALPPGYRRWLREALAVELWPEYLAGQPDPGLVSIARDAERDIKTNNVRLSDLSIDAAWVGSNRIAGYDINSDTTR